MSASLARLPQPSDFQILRNELLPTRLNDMSVNIGFSGGLGERSRPLNPPSPQDHYKEHKKARLNQHARPLQVFSSRCIEAMPFEGRQVEEHMLRRKTPNGTLAAGYDGNQVEWIGRPHVSKHFVMQAESGQGTGTGNLSRFSKGFRATGSACHNGRARQDISRGRDSRNSMLFESPFHGPIAKSELELGLLDHHKRGAPRMDSILNQSQVLQQQQLGGGLLSTPTVLQSSWPPSSGPTALNKQGQYGPYWPDKAFIPYGPAAFRDGGVNSSDDSILHHIPNDGYRHARPLIQRNNQDLSRCDDYKGPTVYQSMYPNTSVRTMENSGSGGQQYPPIDLQGLSLENSKRGNEHLLPKGSHFRTSRSLETGKCLHEHNCPWQTQSRSSSGLRAHHPSCNIFSQNLQFKERMLIEAHRAYLNLLTSQQQARQHVGSICLTNDRLPSHLATQSLMTTTIRPPEAGLPNLASPAIHHVSDEICRPAASIYQCPESYSTTNAVAALDILTQLCQESEWQWVGGILLGGCLAYALANYEKALQWYYRVLACDPNNVEATSNVAATLLSLNRRSEAEQFWLRSVTLRPSYFEAVEHLVGLLCTDQRSRDAVKLIEFVERALKIGYESVVTEPLESLSGASRVPGLHQAQNSSPGLLQLQLNRSQASEVSLPLNFGSSGFAIPNVDNSRMLALIHAKGNMLYGLGNNLGAAKAFEDAILIGTGHQLYGIKGLIKSILRAFANDFQLSASKSAGEVTNPESVLLPPDLALKTASIVFQPNGQLPGLHEITNEHAKRAAISTISNSLLSLAKIYQDGISSGSLASCPKPAPAVHDILALYYLSLSLQPSPSTANNVGILLASVQQASSHRPLTTASGLQHPIAGVAPSSGIALALSYYKYGLELDDRHAHLYTNLGSLLKDIGQLNRAIEMYQKAVACDNNFDIALANLANAVKDQGRICDAISYYRKAVQANPEFAEAVCGLANALNSVCDWKGRGGVATGATKFDRWHVDKDGMLLDARRQHSVNSGLIGRVVTIVGRQLREGLSWGRGVLHGVELEQLLTPRILNELSQHRGDNERSPLLTALESWSQNTWEGAKIVRLVERITKRLCWQLYQERFQHCTNSDINYQRPQLPSTLSIPTAPTVLPFHTFTCPLGAKQIRQISQRNGLRISCSTLRASWLPREIFPPPAPPNPCLRIGYVSSDFNNHPLAHLMQSVFGLHHQNRVKAYCYATTSSDSSTHRKQIEAEAPVFHDASSWSVEQLVHKIVEDGIHILINLNGYTRGARNEVFAARPAPIQMSFMGFAGTLGAEWCDYLLADATAVPLSTLRPYRKNVDLIDQIADGNYSDTDDEWVYGENIIFTRETFFCCDHRQSAPDAGEKQLSWHEEQARRWKMRKHLFPDLADDVVIFGNFNQLYKIEPTTFRTWLRILSRLPNAVLWLLRFPDLGEYNLRETALQWATPDVAARIVFTDVAPKQHHISRARVCDLFLDTPECNAHTTAADVLWSGTPLLTYPRYEYKMCSRMAASILKGALPKGSEGAKAARDLIVASDDEYEERAVSLGASLKYDVAKDGQSMTGFGRGRLSDLRQILYESRWTSPLFDTRRWVRDLEDAYDEAWKKWTLGEGGDIWLAPRQ